MDSYLKDELLVETNHEIQSHVGDCSVCREQLAQRKQLLSRLKVAVNQAQESVVDKDFADRLTRDLRERALAPSFIDRMAGFVSAPNIRLVGAMAGLAFVVIASFFVVSSITNEQTNKNIGVEIASNNLKIADAVRAAWTELAHAATGDHENCAVKYNLAEDPITLDEAATKYGTFNKDLDRSLATALDDYPRDGTEPLKYIEAHSCVYAGRRFAHVVFEQKGKLISILVTDSDLPADGSTPNATIAGFAVDHHAVFVASELGTDENVKIAKFIEPKLRVHFASAKV